MRKRACILLGALVLSLLWCGPAWAQGEQWLQYRSAREASSIAGGLRTLTISTKQTAPAGVDLPQFEDASPEFARWETPMVASGGLWVAVERGGESTVPDKLYIDSNCDGKLSDETPMSAYRADQYNRYFGPVKVVFQTADGPVSYHLNIRYYGSGTPKMYVSSAGWYEGDVTVQGARKHCVLLDYNANGTFNDRSMDSAQSDRIAVSETEGAQQHLLGKYLDVDGTLCNLEVARDGAFVKLTEAQDVTFGRIRVPAGLSSVTAMGENGHFIRNADDGIIELPVGTYHVVGWTIDRRDENDAQWTLRGQGGNNAALTVTDATETNLDVGEPIIADLAASKGQGTYSFNQNLRGRYGEQITLTRNGSRPQAPRLSIRNNDGSYDRTFSFSYG